MGKSTGPSPSAQAGLTMQKQSRGERPTLIKDRSSSSSQACILPYTRWCYRRESKDSRGSHYRTEVFLVSYLHQSNNAGSAGERPEWDQWREPCRRLESGRLRKEEEEQRQDEVRVVQAAVGQVSDCVCVCVCV